MARGQKAPRYLDERFAFPGHIQSEPRRFLTRSGSAGPEGAGPGPRCGHGVVRPTGCVATSSSSGPSAAGSRAMLIERHGRPSSNHELMPALAEGWGSPSVRGHRNGDARRELSQLHAVFRQQILLPRADPCSRSIAAHPYFRTISRTFSLNLAVIVRDNTQRNQQHFRARVQRSHPVLPRLIPAGRGPGAATFRWRDVYRPAPASRCSRGMEGGRPSPLPG